MNKFVLRPWRTSVVLLAAIGISFAAVANEGGYLGLEGGINFQSDQNLTGTGANSQYQFKKGYLGGLGIGYSYLNGLRDEVVLDYRRNNYESRTTAGVTTTNVGGSENVYTFIGSLYYDVKAPTGVFNVVHPYIGAGLGTARVEMHNPSVGGVQGPSSFKALFAYQGGAGVGVDLSRQLTLTADYRYLGTQRGSFNDNGNRVRTDYRSHSALIGLRYFFYTPAPHLIRVSEPVPAAAAAPPPPPPPPPPAPPPPADSDGDGVPDYLDKCPNTPHGYKVDTDGCIIEQTLILRRVNFVFNSDRLTAPAQDTLNGVALALIGQPSLDVQIAGHADSIGSEEYNQKLSQKRAESVRAYLISKGVTADNLQAKGFGKTSPIATNDTAEGRAENRRVEFVVLNKPADLIVKSGDSTEASKEAAEHGEPAHVTKKMTKKKSH